MLFGLNALVVDHQSAQSFVLLDELRILQGFLERIVQHFGDGGWRAFGGIQTVPDGQVKALHAHFLQAGIVLQHRVTAQRLGGGDRKSLDTAAFDLGCGVGGLVAHHVHLTTDQSRHGRGSAAKRDGGHDFLGLHVGLPEQAANVRGRTQARVRNVQLAGIGADVVFKVAVGVGRQLRLAHQSHGHIIDHAQKLEVLEWLVTQFAVQGWCRGHADVEQQQRMAVRCSLGHFGGADGATSPCSVFHNEVAAWNVLAHHFGQVTGNAVGGTACGEGHDDRNGLATREGLGVRAHREGGQSGQGDPLLHDKLLVGGGL